jgi:Protein of unknown function (DUF3349)
MHLAATVTRLIVFLRAGYPSGMPPTGYLPLAALLRRRLSDDEITAMTSGLTMPISSADVGVHITRITNDLPSQDDIERVQRRLEVRG